MATPAAPTKRATPNVAYIRPEYTALKPRWQLIRDCLSGEEQVKKRGDAYLPRPNPTDTSDENKARYTQYVQRAVYYNVTGRTHAGLVGQVVSVPAQIELPTLLEPMLKDVDGAGVSLDQQSQKALGVVLAHGRAGLMTDYPVVAEATTRAQLQKGAVRPTICLVEPWDVINWRTVTVGGIVKLALVVISEQYVTDDDGFEQEYDDQWRVLRLDEDGLCVIEEYIRDEQHPEEFILKPTEDGEAQYFPVNASGARLDYVPFTFIGATNNDCTPDLPPLYDMAVLNIAHYRNSADYEEACYIMGQPTMVLAGLTEAWVKDVLKGVVQLGSRAAVMLPEGGSTSLVQATANTMPKEAMDHKERQMVAIGAKLVEQSQVQRTALEASMENASETSTLASIARNVSSAYEQSLRWALAYLDRAPATELKYQLNTDFAIATMNAQDRAQLSAEWQSGAITDEEMRKQLERAGVAYEDFDKWRTKRDEQVLTKPIAAMPSATGAAAGEEPADDAADDKAVPAK